MTIPSAETITPCTYPGCTNPAEPLPAGAPAGATRFCPDPEHNSLGAFRKFRAKRQQRKEDRRAAAKTKEAAALASIPVPHSPAAPPFGQVFGAEMVPAPAPQPDDTVAEEASTEAQNSGMEPTSREAAVSAAMTDMAVMPTADADDATRTRDAIVALIHQLSSDLPVYIEELALITDSAAAEARIETVTRAAAQRIIASEGRAELAEEAADMAVAALDAAMEKFEAEAAGVREEADRKVADAEFVRAELERYRERVGMLEVRLDAVRDESDQLRRERAGLPTTE
ncbi:hypothetical protein OG524_33430 [Streptomyces sp. NBC_01520]|uniref:hypothetical protein n=1 Tax=Streptomyces sp. NBC_01520 TaxID=2903892 RepID=UPI0038691FE0